MSCKVSLILALALLSILQARPPPPAYQLSPDIPPTAFVDQYYTCTFRVGGLTRPRFSFNHLPPPLKGSRNGNIEGIPSASGSYSITVNYQ